jgi:hypothetical protein
LAGLLIGGTAAATSTPGASRSGLSRSPLLEIDGPTDEKSTMDGARCGFRVNTDSDAVAPAVAAYALIAWPSVMFTCAVGTEWVSATRPFAAGFAFRRIMPTPPASLTFLLLSTRALSPR